MYRDPSETALRVRGEQIATLTDLEFVFDVPEDRQGPPAVVGHWIAGAEIEPAELYSAFDGPMRDVVAGDDHAQAIVEAVLSKLRATFPNDVPDAG